MKWLLPWNELILSIQNNQNQNEMSGADKWKIMKLASHEQTERIL
jgi:hypothetical protein